MGKPETLKTSEGDSDLGQVLQALPPPRTPHCPVAQRSQRQSPPPHSHRIFIWGEPGLSLGTCGLGASLGTLLTPMLTDSQARLLEFLVWHMGSSSCFNAMFHEAFRFYHLLRLGLSTSAGLNEWWVQNTESPCPRRNVCGSLPYLPPSSGAGSGLPIPCTLLDHPPTQTMEAHSLLYSVFSLTPPGYGHSSYMAPQSLRPASRSSADPLC